MIVEEPPYDLVAVFADADAKALFEELIERAQERGCIRPIKWRSLRDPMRDAVRADPLRILRPLLAADGPCALIVWDHEGSGAESRNPSEVEAEVQGRVGIIGMTPDRIAAVAMRPEVEATLVPVWDRVKELAAQLRSQLPPADNEVHAEAQRRWQRRGVTLPADTAEALSAHPKEMFEALLRILNLRFSASLFHDLGRRLSIPRMKENPEAARLAATLVGWFPPGGPAASP